MLLKPLVMRNTTWHATQARYRHRRIRAALRPADVALRTAHATCYALPWPDAWTRAAFTLKLPEGRLVWYETAAREPNRRGICAAFTPTHLFMCTRDCTELRAIAWWTLYRHARHAAAMPA